DPGSIAIVGDSMVWGQGVELAQAFPERMQASLRKCGDEGRVYNLGQKGAAFPEYSQVLEQLPHIRRVILCTYPNDIVARPTTALRLRQLMMSLGNTSGVFRVLADIVGVKMFPDARAYVSSVIEDWNTTDATYPLRWNQLQRIFEQTARRTVEISREKPLFVLFPIMMNFKDYPLRSVHQQ